MTWKAARRRISVRRHVPQTVVYLRRSRKLAISGGDGEPQCLESRLTVALLTWSPCVAWIATSSGQGRDAEQVLAALSLDLHAVSRHIDVECTRCCHPGHHRRAWDDGWHAACTHMAEVMILAAVKQLAKVSALRPSRNLRRRSVPRPTGRSGWT